jgi:predicted dithiol-disulfide oxidoreductase (DUF899 family)
MATENISKASKVVSPAEWLVARKELLRKEKEFTRLRDELSRQRRELPWEKVEKEYVFDGPNGRETLSDLFGGKSQLMVYHFMFGPEWPEGCPSCSFLADHFDGSVAHLAARDVRLAVVSRAPLPRIEAFKKRMGWRFKWCPRTGTISIATTRYRGQKRRSPRVRPTTITRCSNFRARKGLGQACFIRMRLAMSSTRIQLTVADLIC